CAPRAVDLRRLGGVPQELRGRAVDRRGRLVRPAGPGVRRGDRGRPLPVAARRGHGGGRGAGPRWPPRLADRLARRGLARPHARRAIGAVVASVSLIRGPGESSTSSPRRPADTKTVGCSSAETSTTVGTPPSDISAYAGSPQLWLVRWRVSSTAGSDGSLPIS